MMDMYAFVTDLNTTFFAILPKATTSPRGKENSRVSAKISIETSIPFAN